MHVHVYEGDIEQNEYLRVGKEEGQCKQEQNCDDEVTFEKL